MELDKRGRVVVLDSETKIDGLMDARIELLKNIRTRVVSFELPKVITPYGIAASGSGKFEQVLFLRDAAICGISALEKKENFGIEELLKAVRQTLVTTSEHIGKKADGETAEEPGKPPHEIHGPNSNQQRLASLEKEHWPVKRVDGHLEMVNWHSLDAPFLWVILFAKYVAITKDFSFRNKLWSKFENVMNWILKYADKDRDGLVEYGPQNEYALKNQCWRDSDDSLTDEESNLPIQPIAPLDANCFSYWADLEAAKLYAQKKDYEKAGYVLGRARLRRQVINRLFFWEREGLFVPALDANKKPINIVTADSAIALWTGVADSQKTKIIAARLLRDDLFSPYGLRSRSKSSKFYNPTKYQNGNVWLQIALLAAAGCEKYGLDEEAETFDQVLGGIAELNFGELTGVDEGGAPFPYLEEGKPVSCFPMAWVLGGVLNRTAKLV